MKHHFLNRQESDYGMPSESDSSHKLCSHRIALRCARNRAAVNGAVECRTTPYTDVCCKVMLIYAKYMQTMDDDDDRGACWRLQVGR